MKFLKSSKNLEIVFENFRLEITLKIEKFLPEGTKYYPPGSPEAYENCRDGYHGCYVSEGEPLEGIALALALVLALVFAASIVVYIIWSI